MLDGLLRQLGRERLPERLSLAAAVRVGQPERRVGVRLRQRLPEGCLDALELEAAAQAAPGIRQRGAQELRREDAGALAEELAVISLFLRAKVIDFYLLPQGILLYPRASYNRLPRTRVSH